LLASGCGCLNQIPLIRAHGRSWRSVVQAKACSRTRQRGKAASQADGLDAASQQGRQKGGQVSQDEKTTERMRVVRALRPIMGNSQINKITGGNHEERREYPP
jgi:hypothetical protein